MLYLSELFGFILVSLPAIYLYSTITDLAVLSKIHFSLIVSIGCGIVTLIAIPRASHYLLRKGLKGKDMGKRGTIYQDVEVPSGLGLICSIVFMTFVIVTQMVNATQDNELLNKFNAALLSICFMTLLGFCDDVLDLPWRYKLLLPTIASLPLLCTYTGKTTVLMPKPLRHIFYNVDTMNYTAIGAFIDSLPFFEIDPRGHGALVDLGMVYYLYMGMLAVFATNAINIYAGINGLEAGQSLIIACSIAVANLFEIASGAGVASSHMFSLSLALPFIATNIALLYHNVYPAKVFVGDTFCYFAGMTFACMAILGHFSKTLLLFFVPQIFNFIYSLPQLFKVVPCPRHRLPDYDPVTNTVRPSGFYLEDPTSAPVASSPTSTTVETPSKGNSRRRSSVSRKTPAKSATSAPPAQQTLPKRYDNLTLINLMLRILGPMHERSATNVLLLLQIVSCSIGLLVRYRLGPSLFFNGLHETIRY
jgi:UDP-N-acetylglucosamine--dolichyl-phosphate N-acetylglucosaminephosphotransferase